jgi:hypothetical protein
MKRWTQWFDQMVERVCDWLNGILPRQHGLVSVGYRLAGMRKCFLLPVDRRTRPSVLQMAYDYAAHTQQMYKKKAKAGTSGLESDCGFWAYCHISGVPCQRCKPAGIASINFLNPKNDGVGQCDRLGKLDGTFWYGCCKNPAGQLRMIAFFDCCSKGFPVPQDCGGAWAANACENWPAAKDWCFNSEAAKKAQRMEDPPHVLATYYCTVVIDQGECP